MIKLILKLAWQEILAKKRFSALFILNLAIGLTGFATLNSFKSTFQSKLKEQSQIIAASDISISGRRLPTIDEKKIIDSTLGPSTKESKVTSLFTMLTSQNASKLVELQAIDNNFPLYGQIELEKGGVITHHSNKSNFYGHPVIWISKDVQKQLHLEIGQSLTIGAKTFTVADIIKKDLPQGTGAFAMVSRVYISEKNLSKTDLIDKGSTVRYRLLYKIPAHQNSSQLAQALHNKITDPALRVASHESASEQTGRLIKYLNDFLGLVCLVGLFLAGLGGAYLYRGYLNTKLKDIAILRSLGLSPASATGSNFAYIFYLSLFASLLASLFATLFIKFLPYALTNLLPVAFEPVFDFSTIGLTTIISLFTGIMIVLPWQQIANSVSPANLFHEHNLPSLQKWQNSQYAIWILIIFTCFGLAVFQAKSLTIGGLFTMTFFLFAAIFVGIATFCLKMTGHISKRASSLAFKLALLAISRKKFHSVMTFLTIALGAMLTCLIPQIENSLHEELNFQSKADLPEYFLFDIQEEDLFELEKTVTKMGGNLIGLSPMISARLVEINGQPFAKGEWIGNNQFTLREQEWARASQRRNFNLTYKDTLNSSEKIIAGHPFQTTNSDSDMGQISLETRFASRMNLGIGDKLTFDISGISVSGIVVNLRRIKWTSFLPNFFIQFNSQALQEAPQIYLAAISQSSFSANIYDAIIKQFPNISIINISELIETILSLVKQFSWILQSMAWLALAAGFFTLLSISRYQIQTRNLDTSLLKVLGASFKTIQHSYLLEFSLIASLSTILGAFSGLFISWIFSYYLFDEIWVPNIMALCQNIFIIILISVSIALGTTRKVLKSPTNRFLNNQI